MRGWRPSFGERRGETRQANPERYLGEIAPLLDSARRLDALSSERKRVVRRRIMRTVFGSRRMGARAWLAPALVALAALVLGGAAFAMAERLGLIPSVGKPATIIAPPSKSNVGPKVVHTARPVTASDVPSPLLLPVENPSPVAGPHADHAAEGGAGANQAVESRATTKPSRRVWRRVAYAVEASRTPAPVRVAADSEGPARAARATATGPTPADAPQWVEPVYSPLRAAAGAAVAFSPPTNRPVTLPTDNLRTLPSDASLFGEAMRSLRVDHNPSAALATLQSHARSYPHSSLTSERAALEVEALLALHRDREALVRLDAMPLAGLPRSGERFVVRGELRAAARRWPEARADFDEALARVSGTPSWHERALWGRAVARLRCGEREAGLADIERYNDEYPDGRFAAEAARFLSAR